MTYYNYGSWGRYPKLYPSEVIKINWKDQIPPLNSFSKPVLPYGYGKSYGDSCLNDGGVIIDMSGMNHFIEFNPKKMTFKCEAGTSLAEILDFLVPRGFFLAATPGTKYITVGGAVANDVHGKNHHINGTFGNNTLSFKLLRSNGESFVCSRDENKELFSATIGGLGLTGLITWIEFKIIPCPSAFFEMESIKFESLDEFFEINDDSSKGYDYTVSWVDCTAIGSNVGRGLFNRGNHADPKKVELPKLPKQKISTFPFDKPFINELSVNLFNVLYFNKQFKKISKKIVHYNPFFYPLDAIADWNKAYGKNGFLQYQFVIPHKTGKEAVRKILKIVSTSGLPSFLTVLKTFGDIQSPGMLSFPRPGITMAIDFRFVGQRTLDLCNVLDEIVRDNGGVIYPAKDARMSAADFQRFYPQWKQFSEYIDPKFSSSFWRRVTK